MPPDDFCDYAERVACYAAQYFGIWWAQVFTNRKTGNIARARSAAIACLHDAGTSFINIATIWGQDHTYALYCARRAEPVAVAYIKEHAGAPCSPWRTWRIARGIRCEECGHRHCLVDSGDYGNRRCPSCCHEWRVEA